MIDNTYQNNHPNFYHQQQQHLQENNQSFTLQESPPHHHHHHQQQLINIKPKPIPKLYNHHSSRHPHIIQNRLPPSSFQQLPSQDEPQTEQSFNLLGGSKNQSLSSFQESIKQKLSQQQHLLSMQNNHHQVTMEQIDPVTSNNTANMAMIERMSDPNISAQFGSPIVPISSNQTFEVGSLAKIGGFLNLNASSCRICERQGEECVCRRRFEKENNFGFKRRAVEGEQNYRMHNAIREEQDESSRFQQQIQQQMQQQQEETQQQHNTSTNIHNSASQYTQQDNQQQDQDNDNDTTHHQQTNHDDDLYTNSNQFTNCQNEFINIRQNNHKNASTSQFKLSPQTTAQFHPHTTIYQNQNNIDKILIRQNSNQKNHQRTYSSSNATQPPSARSYLTQVAQLQDNQLIGTSTSIKSTVKMKRQLGDLQSKIDQLQQKLTDNTSRISDYYNKIGIKMEKNVMENYKQIQNTCSSNVVNHQSDLQFKRNKIQPRFNQQRKSQDCKSTINNLSVKGFNSSNQYGQQLQQQQRRNSSSIVNLHKFHQDKRSSSLIQQRNNNNLSKIGGSSISTITVANDATDDTREYRLRTVDNQLGDSCQSSAVSSTTNLSQIPYRNAQQTTIKMSQLRSLKKKANQLLEYKRKHQKLQNQYNEMQQNFKVSQQIRRQQKGIIKDLKSQIKQFKILQKTQQGSSLLITDHYHRGQNQVPNSMPASTKSSSTYLKKGLIHGELKSESKFSIGNIGKGKTVISKLGSSSNSGSNIGSSNVVKKGGIQVLVSKQKKFGKSKLSFENSNIHDDTIDSRKLESVQAFQPRYQHRIHDQQRNHLYEDKQVEERNVGKGYVKKQSNSISIGMKSKKRSVSRKKKNLLEMKAAKIR